MSLTPEEMGIDTSQDPYEAIKKIQLEEFHNMISVGAALLFLKNKLSPAEYLKKIKEHKLGQQKANNLMLIQQALGKLEAEQMNAFYLFGYNKLIHLHMLSRQQLIKLANNNELINKCVTEPLKVYKNRIIFALLNDKYSDI